MNEYDENGSLKGDHPLTICNILGCNNPVREWIDPDYCPVCKALMDYDEHYMRML